MTQMAQKCGHYRSATSWAIRAIDPSRRADGKRMAEYQAFIANQR
jgi:hypothetical protein